MITEICIGINNFQSRISGFTTFMDGWVGENYGKDQLSLNEVEIRTEFGKKKNYILLSYDQAGDTRELQT